MERKMKKQELVICVVKFVAGEHFVMQEVV